MNESSAEARLERLRGLSRDYIFDLYDKLKKIIKKESSKEKRKKMRIIGEELRIEYGRKRN